MGSIKNSGKGTWTDRNPGVLSNRRSPVAGTEKRVERPQKHRDGRKKIQKDGIERKEYRYYISSLKEDVELFSRAVRGHWSVESMHWHLDVTFKEDANTTLDKQAAENLNIIRKWCLGILKTVEIFRPNLSMKKKRFVISMNPAEFMEQVLNF